MNCLARGQPSSLHTTLASSSPQLSSHTGARPTITFPLTCTPPLSSPPSRQTTSCWLHIRSMVVVVVVVVVEVVVLLMVVVVVVVSVVVAVVVVVFVVFVVTVVVSVL